MNGFFKMLSKKNILVLLLCVICSAMVSAETMHHQHKTKILFSPMGNVPSIYSIKIDFQEIGEKTGIGFGGEYCLVFPNRDMAMIHLNLIDVRKEFFKDMDISLIGKAQVGWGIASLYDEQYISGLGLFRLNFELLILKFETFSFSLESFNSVLHFNRSTGAQDSIVVSGLALNISIPLKTYVK
jgi:hypothetical protein